jgi:hypothetical protein
VLTTLSTNHLRSELSLKWEELKVSPAERIETLTSLLDAAQATPQLLAIYETANTKLAARQPIAQVGYMRVVRYYTILCVFIYSH